jgi:hypothetical protein
MQDRLGTVGRSPQHFPFPLGQPFRHVKGIVSPGSLDAGARCREDGWRVQAAACSVLRGLSNTSRVPQRVGDRFLRAKKLVRRWEAPLGNNKAIVDTFPVLVRARQGGG